MESQSQRMLGMMDELLARLRQDPERDEHIERIIVAIEDERAKLLASALGRGRAATALPDREQSPDSRP